MQYVIGDSFIFTFKKCNVKLIQIMALGFWLIMVVVKAARQSG